MGLFFHQGNIMRLTKEVTKRFEVPNDPDGGYIILRHIKSNVLAEIIDRTSSTRVENGEVVGVISGLERKKEIAKEGLTGWGNFEDESGRPLKFTPANIAKAAEFSIVTEDGKTSFFDWIDTCLADLADEVEEEQKAATEN